LARRRNSGVVGSCNDAEVLRGETRRGWLIVPGASMERPPWEDSLRGTPISPHLPNYAIFSGMESGQLADCRKEQSGRDFVQANNLSLLDRKSCGVTYDERRVFGFIGVGVVKLSIGDC
jgi:hypothetical protein